jgi:hypothetical protein
MPLQNYNLTRAEICERMIAFKNKAQHLLDAVEAKEPKKTSQSGFRSLKEELAQELKNLAHAARSNAISRDVECFYYPAVAEAKVAVNSLRWNSDPSRPEWYSKVHDIVLAIDHLLPKD